MTSSAIRSPGGSLVRGRYVPTVVYAREEPNFHTRLCVYNYFSEIYPDEKTGAVVAVSLFNQRGDLLAQRDVSLNYRGQLQLDLSEFGIIFEGTAAVALIPDTAPKIDHDRKIATGYYVYYYDDAGHADYSHEWDPMAFTPTRSAPWLCVVRPALCPNTELVVMNAYYGEDRSAGMGRYVVRLRNSQGHILAEQDMPVLPPRGSGRVAIGELFPDIQAHASRESTLAVEVQGSNIQGPFTFVTIAGGDFNIHHFC